MQDPIGSFLRIRDLYLSYLDTAFRIKDRAVTAERQRLLRSPGALCTEPLIEPVPRYQSADVDLWDLVAQVNDDAVLRGWSSEDREAFVDLVLAGLFPSKPGPTGDARRRVPDYRPHSHQIAVLARGVQAGSPAVVTSGTGSGKTEAFFLPLFAALAREARGWEPPGPGYLKTRWWIDPTTRRPFSTEKDGRSSPSFAKVPGAPTAARPNSSAFRQHREHERRPAAVRALILYPMNALVEDQMVRLRKALDSCEAREVMDHHFGGNRLFFGRYTSKTPVTGHRRHPAFDWLLELQKKDPRLEEPVDPATGAATLGELRENEFKRRKRAEQRLFDEMVAMQDGQLHARHHAAGKASPQEGGGPPGVPSAFGSDAPFMFPSIDGGELTSRWDIQETPPDVLITNVSMLSAMLTREADRPIFDKTKAWLETPDSYFYLILDELHLQRGSAGTEVCYLLRLLLHRLGLDSSPEQRAKLRVLASSASLPNSPDDVANESASYLWDMFGRFGLPARAEVSTGLSAWKGAIVPGVERPSTLSADAVGTLRSRPFIELLVASSAERGGSEGANASPLAEPKAGALWRAIADLLVVNVTDAPIEEVVAASIQQIAAHLTEACRGEGRTRATPVRELAWRLFSDLRESATAASGLDYDTALEAVRAITFARGCADEYPWGAAEKRLLAEAPSFRVHTFFRSIEGLYAPAVRGLGVVGPDDGRIAAVGALSIERENRLEVRTDDGQVSARLLELLYCEACGELFFGGNKSTVVMGKDSGTLAELLPHEPQLDGLPDASASQRFEELSHAQYALFWPSERQPMTHPAYAKKGTEGRRIRRDPGQWLPATLDPRSGLVFDADADPAPELLPGHLYARRHGARDDHERTETFPETHVPYMCPRCGTDYIDRGRGQGRLSPIRNFRAGFGKTTQLLATELFDAQRVSNGGREPAKLVSFSDSRQDAARAALDIERNHHQDLRRELLVVHLHRHRSRGGLDVDSVEKQVRDGELVLSVLPAESPLRQLASKEVHRLRQLLVDAADPAIALTSVVEALGSSDRSVSPIVKDMACRGVHPFDDAGVERVVGRGDADQPRYFFWNALFEPHGGDLLWATGRSGEEQAHATARRNLLFHVQKVMSDVIFSKTYFSIEEAGLAWVTVRASDLPESRRSTARVDELSALLRVLSDCYRYWPNKYKRERGEIKDYTAVGDVHQDRVLAYSRRVWGDAWEERLMEAVADLGKAGHEHGVINVERVFLELASPGDQFWECGECGRVHLHRGTGSCTRCLTALPPPSGLVSALQERSFLARRVTRALAHEAAGRHDLAGFRLHCEELTGQTDDPAKRQREFRGIFVSRRHEHGEEGAERLPDGGTLADTSPQDVVEDDEDVKHALYRARAEIDLLAVTTTMEVGIDIGPLQIVLQANMPPQRFNYQQRVGRAGRRGQAYSMVLTICRTRSHDIFYFREPKRMTGDTPPTPFLTKTMPTIADRFLRKFWLIEAFGRIRERRRAAGAWFPGDVMSPPDIHGEFVPVDEFDANRERWLNLLRPALVETTAHAARFAALLASDSTLPTPSVDVEKLLSAVEEHGRPGVANGLAQTLAEYGLLPMYGMPTRERPVYTEIALDHRRPELRTMSRDLEVAIYEYAPDAKVVKDKYEHLCIGFTPTFGLPEYLRYGSTVDVKLFQAGAAFGERFRVLQCPHCSAWRRVAETEVLVEPVCAACGRALDAADPPLCVVPNAFRTDLRPRPRKEDASGGSRHRSVQAEGSELKFSAYAVDGASTNVAVDVATHEGSRTFRLNRGPLQADGSRGFRVVRGTQELTVRGATLVAGGQAIAEPHLRGASDDTEASRQWGIDLVDREPAETVWLAAPKTTHALFIAPRALQAGLALFRLPGRTDESPVREDVARWQGVRAAALSATYLVVNRVSMDLDIDPEELEVLEPRLYGPNEDRRPILQITDALVNGSGFCRNLGSGDGGRMPRIVGILSNMINRPDEYPLRDLSPDPAETRGRDKDHSGCDTACYRCLLRYGNQAYHGLLDWQLGLTYLRSILDPTFDCGLSDSTAFTTFAGLSKWRPMAIRSAQEMARNFHGEARWFADGAVPGFRIASGMGKRRRLSPWVLVSHPLWDWDREGVGGLGALLARAAEEATVEGVVPLSWDTFNLLRRPVQVREWIVRAS